MKVHFWIYSRQQLFFQTNSRQHLHSFWDDGRQVCSSLVLDSLPHCLLHLATLGALSTFWLPR